MRPRRPRGRALPRILALSVTAALVLGGCVSLEESVPPTATTSPSLRSPVADAPGPSAPLPTPNATTHPSSTDVPTAATWEAGGRMVTAHAFHTATLLLDGTVLVAGGKLNDRLDGQPLAAAERYDPVFGTWTATGRMKQTRWGHTATLLADGKVLVAGGYLDDGGLRSSAELYDPSTGLWSATANMSTGRGGHTATLLPDGRVLVVGGGGDAPVAGEGGPLSATAELYDPVSRRWSGAARMTEARAGFSATLLADGRVLVAGGDGTFKAAELFDPASGRWTSTASMSEPRFGHTATRLADGTVLVTGGCACSDFAGAVASAERFDPGTGTWTVTGSMHVGRVFHTATLLTSGLVLVVDDGIFDQKPGSAETYDAGGGSWTVTASPVGRNRFGYTATLLADGRVLLAGDDNVESPATTEVYAPTGWSPRS
jgi:hypothetical protein